ncbi:MAG: MarR family transcriptional regulator [Clostridium sp.]|jgi:DNA-binding MarR family transcriptional regulator|uniref:MarR family winged helix-turn-helix transcriptional regulator n=1 Tax=Clostridium sp. TaxID=1506 RepID=UPI0025B8507F|nr:MarR family transcriptional regulator [Clostridium sp.]MCH3964661.1 MarR family transcriptional regulator [Clostridium sp.]MCI1715132.1 MarR family transcriptional regulator [Clostridium sp.]MCI1799394.1 MarR family transcriptional regulator [Clostridium sp.]MCI1813315.1 MarR family transcriptional regulator [Clostridium sp.]MCI1870206.1 MarR family transcriptional regulator [Clostridium sp.]
MCNDEDNHQYIPEILITHWIRMIYRNMTNLYNCKLNELSLTISQVCVLSRLWIKDGLTQKEIALELQIRPASLTALVNTLVSKGWAIRKGDREDARINRIYLTDSGRDFRSKCAHINDEMEELLSRGFSKEEKQLLLVWLKRIYENME